MATGTGTIEGGGGKVAAATRGSFVAPVAGAAGAAIPAGTGMGALGFSLNLTAASAADAAIGDGGAGGSTGNFSTGAIIPIGGSESGGGSTGEVATVAAGGGISPEGAAGTAGCGGCKSGCELPLKPTGGTPVPRGMGVPPMSSGKRSLTT